MRKIFKHPLILSLLIIFSLIFLNYQGWLKIPQNIIFSSTSFIQENIYRLLLKSNSFVEFIVSVGEVNQENARLKQDNEKLLGEVARLNEIAKENEFLRKQMGLTLLKDKELILANIISQSSTNLGEYLFINKGEKDGISEKAVVITAGNFLIGKVIKRFDSFSMIQLIIDPGSRVNAVIQNSGLSGLIIGDKNSGLFLDLLPQGENIEEGSMVLTSGRAGLFPAGLIIGRIEKVISSDVQISQMAKVKPVVDFNKLEKVFVIKD